MLKKRTFDLFYKFNRLFSQAHLIELTPINHNKLCILKLLFVTHMTKTTAGITDDYIR